MSSAMIGSVIIFGLTFYGILSRRINRTIAVMMGAVAMVFFGHWLGFYEPSIALDYIDFNTIGLLLGMMILVGVLGETGFFKFLAIKTARFSKGSYYRLLAFFVLVTAFTSAFLDNVTTVLLMAPITITITDELDIDPIPFLIAGIISSNIGGAATLVGDPPNMVIGSLVGINFNAFILYLAPIVIIILFSVLLVFEIIFEDTLDRDSENFRRITEMDEKASITDKDLFYKSMIALSITIFLFTIHHIIGIEPWLVAMTGASIVLFLSFTSPERPLKHVHWATLLFFAGKFILVGGLDRAGVLRIVGSSMATASGGYPVLGLFVLLMVSGIFAMLVGNIPSVIALIPAVNVFIQQTQFFVEYPINPLWWALSLGVCLGGSGTLVGAHANLMVSSISEKMGHPLSFVNYTKTALPITIFSLLLSFFLLWAFFVVLM